MDGFRIDNVSIGIYNKSDILELVLLPLYFGLVAFIVSPKFGRYFILTASLTSLGAGLARLFSYQPDTYQTLFSLSKTNALGFSMEIGYDGLSLVMVGLSNLVFFLVALANLSKEESRSSLFNGLFLLMQFGLNGLFLAQDGLLFYVFWELALIPIFLILYWFGANDSQKTWFKFFLYTLFGSLGMLFSLIALTQFGFKSFASMLADTSIAITMSIPRVFFVLVETSTLCGLAIATMIKTRASVRKPNKQCFKTVQNKLPFTNPELFEISRTAVCFLCFITYHSSSGGSSSSNQSNSVCVNSIPCSISFRLV